VPVKGGVIFDSLSGSVVINKHCGQPKVDYAGIGSEFRMLTVSREHAAAHYACAPTASHLIYVCPSISRWLRHRRDCG
jgi:hypothetical protein